jgi:protein gp37
MNRTRIPWCDWTWNPIVGCSPASEGCANCYAAAISKRFHLSWGKAHFIPERLDQPAKVHKTGRVFVCSMGDLFHPSVDVCQIDAVVSAMVHPMGGMNHHTYILLTKRIERLLNDPHCRPEHFANWPNVWLGVTVENQKRADERVPLLMKIPAAVRFVSVEPMLGPVDLSCWLASGKLSWVIAGPETGPRRRPFDEAWLDGCYGLDAQCRTYGAAFFDKRDEWTRREFPSHNTGAHRMAPANEA